MPAECSTFTMVLNSLIRAGRPNSASPGRRSRSCCSPSSCAALLEQMPVVDEGMHRHQLDGGDAQAHQVIDDRRGGESGVGAAQVRRHFGVAHRQSAHVRLVDDGVVPGNTRRTVIAPGEGGIDHAALRRAGRAVAAVEGQVRLGVPGAIAEVRVAPLQRSLQVLGVGLDQELVRIETVAALGIVRPVHAIAVQQARTCLRKVDMPVVVGALAQLDALDFVPAGTVEQAQLDLGRHWPRTARN